MFILKNSRKKCYLAWNCRLFGRVIKVFFEDRCNSAVGTHKYKINPSKWRLSYILFKSKQDFGTTNLYVW